jgi:hypothetical protein
MEETGIRLRLRLSATIDENRHNQILAARDAVAMLLSLILSFTMVMAVQRYDHRRELLVDEANAIGTASLRAQTLPEPSRDKGPEAPSGIRGYSVHISHPGDWAKVG